MQLIVAPRQISADVTSSGSGRGRSWPTRIGSILLCGLAVVLAGACGQGDGDPNNVAVDTDVQRLDTDGVVTLGSDMAGCLRDIVGVEVDDDFLLAGSELPYDFAEATPEQEQALVACFNGIEGFSDVDGLDREVLQVDVGD